MVHLVVFLNFKFYSWLVFTSVDLARQYEKGLKRGYTLGVGSVAHAPLFTAVLPEDHELMSDIIPEGEIQRAWEAIKS